MMPLDSCTVGHRALKSSRDPKIVNYSLQKSWTIAHENGQKCPKSRVLTIPLESCTVGHKVSKSSRDPKIVNYSLQKSWTIRKRPEMSKITSFDNTARVVYRGSQGIHQLSSNKLSKLDLMYHFFYSMNITYLVLPLKIKVSL